MNQNFKQCLHPYLTKCLEEIKTLLSNYFKIISEVCVCKPNYCTVIIINTLSFEEFPSKSLNSINLTGIGSIYGKRGSLYGVGI